MGTNGSDEQLNGLTEKLVSVVREALNEALHCTEQADTDLQTLEQATIAAMQRIGEHFLGILIKACQPREPARTIPCNCGERAKYIRMRTGRVITLVDQIEISRAYYLCEECGEGTYPLDERLGFCAGALSAGLEEALALTGVHLPFELASDLFERLSHIAISDNSVRKATEQIGAEREADDAERVAAAWDWRQLELPDGPAQPPKRLYGSIDETSVHTEEGWRKAKLGSWYTTDVPPAEQRLEEWEPRAEEISYFGDITDADTFGRHLYVTGLERGADRADELIFVADGAQWIWNLVEEHFPAAVEIVDWYHASEYVWDVAHAVYGEESDLATAWAEKRLDTLWEGKLDAVLDAFREHLDPEADDDPAQTAITYFENNRHRMRYGDFRARGYHIGSGTIESGCKRVIGARLKQAGMIWSLEGARQMIKARTMYLSGEWDDFCQRRQPPRRTYRKRCA